MQIILENLYKAYFEARKNKRFTVEQLKFEQNYEHNLQVLFEQILTNTYKVAPCKAFVIEKPVYREVFAPQFIDRVIHHFIVLYINPQVEQVLIEDCYSCRKGKGTLYGIERTKQKMKSITQNYAKDAYILKLDIVPGNRNNSTGALNNVGSNGNYWSSSVSGTNATNRNFSAGSTNDNSNNRANGLTVRCLKV